MDRNTIAEFKQKFENFLDFDLKGEYDTYSDRILDMVEGGDDTRLVIQMEHLREFTDISQFLADPSLWIFAWEENVNELIKDQHSESLEEVKKKFGDNVRFKIGLGGVMGSLLTSPRFLLSRHLNQFVCVEGIITRSGLVSPRIQKSVHFAEKSSKYLERTYNDETNVLGRSTIVVFPKTLPNSDEPVDVEYGLCSYKDTQTIYLQEMPECAPAGQLPRSVTVHLESDLVDSFKPGDRVKVMGIFHLIRPDSNRISTRVRSVVNAINIVASEEKDWKLSSQDVKKFRNLNAIATERGVDMMDVLYRSVAPSIFGHDNIKKAILLQQVGGVERILDNGIKQRGDIHLLFVGDPGTAKSQLLRFAMNSASISISTTGRASTGVGLTAAVVTDPDTHEPSLAAGAMVLGDRGLVGVDEFDKMNEIDRAAMHEVMEQQTCTIQKAGVHTTLNARVSVLAAANPIFGSYNPKISVQKNVGLPDSLLSRFDLVFIVLDKKDEDLDRQIGMHVCKLHMNFETDPDDQKRNIKKKKDENQGEDIEDKLLVDTGEGIDLDRCVFSLAFLRKYIKFAKIRITPELEDDQEIIDLIASKYDEMRELAGSRHNDPNEEEEDGGVKKIQTSLPVTPRSLEGLVRLIKAHAKLRLSPKVEKKDVHAAYELMKSTIFLREEEIERFKIGKQEKKKMTDEDDDDERNITGKKRRRREDEEEDDDEKKEKEDEKKKKERMVDLINERLPKLVRDQDIDDVDKVLENINHMLIANGYPGIRAKDLENIVDENDWQFVISLDEDERTIYCTL